MKNLIIFPFLAIALAVPSRGITVNLSYQDDSDTFFTPLARSTLLKAASDVSFAVTTSLSALNQSSYSGTNGSTTATVDWSFRYSNPNTGANAPDVTTFDFLADEFRVVVGRRTLGGTTLGRGGPSGAGISLGGSGFENEWPGAIDAMEAASNATMPRGGPALGLLSGDFQFGATPGPYDLNYGFAIGALVFDDMTSWNFSYDTLPTASQNDFYSVAVHEILHSIGLGASRAWDVQKSGTDWMGPEVIAMLGTGINVLDSGEAHIRSGLMGSPIIDGVYRSDLTQEAVMDPDITTGTRKYITDLDIAFLNDMGWETVAVPEPSTSLLASGFVILLAARRRRIA